MSAPDFYRSDDNLDGMTCPITKNIDLNLGEQRRTSFLPQCFADDSRTDATVKNVGVVEINEEDDLFMYMQPAEGTKEKPLQKFVTGSKYLGSWNKIGICGKGIYKFPHGVIYDGYFNKNGECHGTGILIYPNGHRVEGMWKNGKLLPDCHFIAAAGIVMGKNYCMMPDRRFQVEVETDFNPVGQEFLTDEFPPIRKIPDGGYDLVDGYYDPESKAVMNYPKSVYEKLSDETDGSADIRGSNKFISSEDELRRSVFREVGSSADNEEFLKPLMRKESQAEEKKTISWIPSPVQEEWIIKNCRNERDDPVGYRPDLYEEWTKGGKADSCQDESLEMDSKFQLHNLNLEKDPESKCRESRFVSFLVNRKHEKESCTVDMLTKMFSKMTTSSPSVDMKMFATGTHNGFRSEEILLLPEKSI